MDYTKSGVRRVRVKSGTGLNWLFLPGGPGLGSESLLNLITQLDLVGTLWRIDLPSDGSNLQNIPIHLDTWQNALMEVVASYKHVVLVGHSFGGMLMQTLPELEKQLVGVVFLNTAPDNYWYRSFAERSKQQDLPNVSLFRKQLLEHPCNAHYAEYLLQSLRYYFREAFLEQGKQLFLTLPFNYKPYFWAIEHFHPTYQASWIPAMPCLIVGSEFDVMTPPDVFEQTPYRANNFRHVTISNAAHFPWIENLSAVQVHLQDFEKVILNA